MARRYKVSRNTVAEALRAPAPRRRKKPPPACFGAELLKDLIDAMLGADVERPQKQRHAIERIVVRPAAEHDFELACYPTVCEYVHKRRPATVLEATQGGRYLRGAVLQEKLPGEEAGVDFADVDRHRLLPAPGHRSRTPGRPVNTPPGTAWRNSEVGGGRPDGRR